MKPFHGKWMCELRFAALAPLDVFHPERTPKAIPPHPEELKNVHMLVRRSFTLQAFRSARLEISADDYYKLKINGKKAGQGPAPGYYFCYYRNSIDVTRFLREGENRIELEVYYQGEINRVWNSGDLRMGFICDLWVDDACVLSSDESWEYALSRAYPTRRMVGYKTQYLEDYDAIYAGDLFWQPCVPRENPDYTFAEEPAVMLEVYPRLPLTQTPFDGGIFYDFGQEITAGLRITARGSAGDIVHILCGEERAAQPPFVRFNMRCNCCYDERWTLGNGVCTVDQYDYKAFRYLALTFPEGVEILSVQAIVRHYPIDDSACVLHTDDPVLEAVFRICKNGVKYGSQEIFMDCPSREKGQYAGDLTVSGATQTYITRDLRLYRKAIENQMQSAFIEEGLMAVTPGSLMQEIADYSLQFPLLALRYYQLSGDRSFLARCLKACEGIARCFGRFARPDGLLDGVTVKWNLVDWPANLRDGYDFPMTNPIGPGCHNVINAFYVGFMTNVEEIQDILGIEHAHNAQKLADAFNAVFLDKDTGLYVDSEGSRHSALHSNILAPFYGFCPASNQERVARFILSRGLCCGVYMSFFLLKGLCRMGYHADAYQIITSTAVNSWYNMVREGGTTCFEAWGADQKSNCSLCHPWASAPIPVLIEDILGYRPDGSRAVSHLPNGISADVVMKPLTR